MEQRGVSERMRNTVPRMDTENMVMKRQSYHVVCPRPWYPPPRP